MKSVIFPAPPFRYLADPVCIFSILAYCINRWCIKPLHLGGSFSTDYFNDLICLPMLLPIILRIQSLLRIRRHDRPPTLGEVIHNWLIFSVLYEVILPRCTAFTSVADPWDAVAYLVGGLGAYVVWNRSRLLKARSPLSSHQRSPYHHVRPTQET